MTITPDISRIIPFKSPESPPPVTIREYTDGDKHLYYINAHHVQGLDNDTCNRIEEAINHLNIQHVVIEASDDFPLSSGGEVEFTNALAKEKHIPVIRGEPSDTQVITDICAKGYSVKDVMALYLVRALPQLQKQGKSLEGKEFDAFATGYLAKHPAFHHIPAPEKLTYEEFRAEYAPRLGKPLVEFNTWDVAPIEDERATFFQKLNAAIGRVRDEHLIGVTGNILNQSEVQNVLVVYGDSHRVVSEPVWEHALGKGVDVEPGQNKGNNRNHPQSPQNPPKSNRNRFLAGAAVAGIAITAGFGLAVYLNQRSKNSAGRGHR